MAARFRIAPPVVYEPTLPPTIPPGMTIDEYRRRRAAGPKREVLPSPAATPQAAVEAAQSAELDSADDGSVRSLPLEPATEASRRPSRLAARRSSGLRRPRRRIGTPAPLPPSPPELAVRHLAEPDLRALRRGIAAALAEIGIGSPAARLLGRIMRLAGSELRRRGVL